MAPPLRKALAGKAPGLAAERAFWAEGDLVVVGIDEVGRGAWAGPLVLGAVVAPADRRITGVRDSKVLTHTERDALFGRITAWAAAWSTGAASEVECDELGMTAALALAAGRAIEALGVVPDRILLDGSHDFIGGGITHTVVKGDATCLSIAAASVVAKVTRDRLMQAEAEHYPGFEFERNKGYPCPRHRMALTAMGPTAIHRRSWAFMDGLPWTGVVRYERVLPAPDAEQSLFD